MITGERAEMMRAAGRLLYPPGVAGEWFAGFNEMHFGMSSATSGELIHVALDVR